MKKNSSQQNWKWEPFKTIFHKNVTFAKRISFYRLIWRKDLAYHKNSTLFFRKVSSWTSLSNKIPSDTVELENSSKRKFLLVIGLDIKIVMHFRPTGCFGMKKGAPPTVDRFFTLPCPKIRRKEERNGAKGTFFGPSSQDLTR